MMNVDDRLNALRRLMKERNFSAYIIPTEDFHGSEYVGEYFKVREYLSGFTGSAGTLIVLSEEAALWTDGRYFLQASRQLAGSPVTLMRAGQPGVPTMAEFLRDHLTPDSIVGFDGRTVTERFVRAVAKKTDTKKIRFDGSEDLADLIWTDRPAMPAEPVWELDIRYAGKSREEKLGKVRAKMREEGADGLLLTALDEIAWLLNLRGNDVAYTPVFLSYMIMTQDKAVLCVREQALSDELRKKLLQAGVTTAPYEGVEQLLYDIPPDSRIWLDSGSVNYRLMHCLPVEVRKIDKSSPVTMMKACKNPCETEHIREAHVKDGVAVTRWIHWLKEKVKSDAGEETERQAKITELSAARQLEAFRQQAEGYLGPSFSPIVAYGPHGAIVHYEPTEQTDTELVNGTLCLADTGGHYLEGTTDVTRTIVLGNVSEEEKRCYTIALRGHLNLGAARFVQGVTGQNLDVLARGPLWESGMDYNHGTGHGVGYVLNVHEGPQRFQWRSSTLIQNVPLEEGMVISNEPGVYLEGKFGIRHENLVLCRKGEKNEYGQFLYLEPLTMVPFDRDAILPDLLSDRERKLLNEYHALVYKTLEPYFSGEEKLWLRQATGEI